MALQLAGVSGLADTAAGTLWALVALTTTMVQDPLVPCCVSAGQHSRCGVPCYARISAQGTVYNSWPGYFTYHFCP